MTTSKKFIAALVGSCVAVSSIGQLHAEEYQCSALKRDADTVMTEVVVYTFINPAATAGAIASMGAVAAVLVDKMDAKTKDTMIGIGLLGLGYCVLSDPAGCDRAVVYMTQRAERLASIEKDRRTLSCPA